MGFSHRVTTPRPPTGSDQRTRLATDAWAQVIRLFVSQQGRRKEVAADLGLSSTDLITLFHLQPGTGVSQRALAEHWACDPSWVTNRVDRLEELGLVERRLSPTDRRVKEVWLTTAGDGTRNEGIAGFGRPPEVLADLSVEDLGHLTRMLDQLDIPDPTRVCPDRATTDDR